MATKSLAHLLKACYQPNLTSSNQYYENEIDLCIIPNQEWRIPEVSLSVSQVHLYARQESVFRTFSATSWISVIYILYSTREEMKYWRKIDSKWNKYLHKLNNI